MARRPIAVIAACLFTVGLSGLPGADRKTAEPRPLPQDRPPAAAGGTPVVDAACLAAARVARPADRLARGLEPYAPTRQDVLRMEADLGAYLDEHGELRGGAATRRAAVNVPTWVHVINNGAQQLPRQKVLDQIAALNSAYSGRLGGADTRVRFRLDGITTTNNAAWFGNPLGYEKAMKTRLRRGGAGTLNLYIAQLNEVVLGYSTYPFAYAASPVKDGVVVDWRSMPGGSLSGFDKGFTAVHEIGHWLGLLHTFENGCAEPGDGVADTPAQATPTGGCPSGKDTCPEPGEDHVHNFMDYSHDRCMTSFTRGQAARMHATWAAYRGTNRTLRLTGDSTNGS
ncbi:hypothetical protein Misp01_01790 [Microtetraspora sp. NBRC 13810]|uniref:zinc metalloprotease n=1 Tax=Microtetraspora sp. NBRC 13810 TaxID=3030990 RepID=UPI0024A17D42|nr:zinc metalloprotease [Microtetraspora sp. NBRC 13810]GLW05049.1 hypothetical protein Misp01_01790 [Microtetraspora sp. NBRC 13810]